MSKSPMPRREAENDLTESLPAMPVQIRLACLEDVPALTQLIAESVRGLQASYYTLAQIEGALGTVFGVDRQLIQDGTYFVAVSGDRIIGCGGWSQRQTLYGGDLGKNVADDRYLHPGIDAAKIRAFFVHPSWARRGIASQIMRRCEAAALESGFKTLEIIATLAGEPLYCRFGYHTTQRFELSLPNGQRLPVVRLCKDFANTNVI